MSHLHGVFRNTCPRCLYGKVEWYYCSSEAKNKHYQCKNCGVAQFTEQELENLHQNADKYTFDHYKDPDESWIKGSPPPDIVLK